MYYVGYFRWNRMGLAFSFNAAGKPPKQCDEVRKSWWKWSTMHSFFPTWININNRLPSLLLVSLFRRPYSWSRTVLMYIVSFFLWGSPAFSSCKCDPIEKTRANLYQFCLHSNHFIIEYFRTKFQQVAYWFIIFSQGDDLYVYTVGLL